MRRRRNVKTDHVVHLLGERLTRQAEQGPAKGCRRALDGESLRQGPLSTRQDAAAADRHAGVRLQRMHPVKAADEVRCLS